MKIHIVENDIKSNKVCYAIFFDTEYFYFGATNNFPLRVHEHKHSFHKKPKRYGIGTFHIPKECTIVKLIDEYTDDIFEHETHLINYHSENSFMLNKKKINKTYLKTIFEINKYINK
jgi:hypothetical protein